MKSYAYGSRQLLDYVLVKTLLKYNLSDVLTTFPTTYDWLKYNGLLNESVMAFSLTVSAFTYAFFFMTLSFGIPAVASKLI